MVADFKLFYKMIRSGLFDGRIFSTIKEGTMKRLMVVCVIASYVALRFSALAAQNPSSKSLRDQGGIIFRSIGSISANASGIWTAQPSGTHATLWSVKSLTALAAWAAGDSGVILRTIDGGATWKKVGAGNIGHEAVYSIEGLDSSTAFATTSPSTGTYIFRTSNGGTSWDTVYSLAGGFVDAIHMFDNQIGIAIGDPVGGEWVVLHTSDGGATWLRSKSEPPQSKTENGSPNCLATVGDSVVVFGSSSGSVYRSTDRGATWVSAGTSQPYVTAIGLLESGVGITTGADPRILPPAYVYSHTIDGGVTWNSMLGPFGSIVNPVAGAGRSEFWGASANTIYRSTDAGVSWHIEYQTQTGFSFLALSVLTSNEVASGWAVAGGGFIYQLNESTLTGAQILEVSIPKAITLNQNYPNPFNPSTTIRYALPARAYVTLAVFNTLGQQVASLVNESQEAGYHEVRFDGSSMASGVYFYRLRAGENVATKKLLVIR